MTDVVIHIIKLAGFTGSNYDGEYLVSFDVDDYDGFGSFETSENIRDAMRFPSTKEAMETWQTQSTVRPYRDDGKPNRPLTSFTIEIVSIPSEQ